MMFQHDQDLLEDDQPIKYGDQIIPNLLIKTPQARKRKINLNDLMNALNLALKVEHKRFLRKEKERILRPVLLPIRSIDITKIIKEVYEKIVGLFKDRQELTFTELVGSDRKEDKILTFIPLLHLCSKHKVDLEQEEHFGEIKIKLM
ncbi:segregation/condensation protein A [Candidatus Woesearchaeota archaeon]|nr:segregation/condensation protein A [Candidatus Woesearchaeota archaeon]